MIINSEYLCIILAVVLREDGNKCFKSAGSREGLEVIKVHTTEDSPKVPHRGRCPVGVANIGPANDRHHPSVDLRTLNSFVNLD